MITNKDLIDQVLGGESVFRDRSKLSPDYVPVSLPHREQQIRELTLTFRTVVIEPGSNSVRGVVLGPTGVGKTATARSFGSDFTAVAKSRNVKLEYIHLNCHRHRTLYLLTLEMAKSLRLPLPNRGLSAQEIFQSIHDYLEKRNINIILVLDEFDYFLNTAPYEDVYFLVRIYDEITASMKRLNYLFIIRDKNLLGSLDKVVKAHIDRNVIEFNPYTSHELYDILSRRVSEAFREGTVQDEGIKFLSQVHGYDTGGSGNARLAIETLEVAGDLADKSGTRLVDMAKVKEANARVNPEMSRMLEEAEGLEIHQLLLIKSLVELTKGRSEGKVSMGQLEEKYREVAEEYGEQARRHTQVYENIRRLKLMGMIETEQSGKGMRGRTTLISLRVPPSAELMSLLEKLIRNQPNQRG